MFNFALFLALCLACHVLPHVFFDWPIVHCFKNITKQNIGIFLKINFIGISTLLKISGCSQIWDEITFWNNKYSVKQDSNFQAAPLPVSSTQPSACTSLIRSLFSIYMHSRNMYVLMYAETFWHFWKFKSTIEAVSSTHIKRSSCITFTR